MWGYVANAKPYIHFFTVCGHQSETRVATDEWLLTLSSNAQIPLHRKVMRGHVTNKKWYNSTYSKLIITKQDRCVTYSAKQPLKGEWFLSQVFFWGQVINETLYILTFTTKHERLMLKIGTNWCSKFIERYKICKKQLSISLRNSFYAYPSQNVCLKKYISLNSV